MKKLWKFTACLLFPVFCNAQTGFDTGFFLNYLESIKGMSLQEIQQKYPPTDVYFSGRQEMTDPMSFQYLDSMEILFGLTQDEKDMISSNHFVVSERLSSMSFAESIIRIYVYDLPFFLSTDLVLHALHLSYDKILQKLEYELLEKNLLVLIQSMIEQLPALYAANHTHPEIEKSLQDVDLFLSVGISLLTGTETPPAYDRSGNYQMIMEEVLKDEPGMITLSLFSDHIRNFDASQFIPRGHYTEKLWTAEGERDLVNYFRAMMWFGRADFYLTPPPVGAGEPPWSDEDIRRMNASAVLMNQVLINSGEIDLLSLHERIISFFVGPDDNLNPFELKGIIEKLNFNVNDIYTEEGYELFQEEITSSDDYGQKILSDFFYVDADQKNPAELPVSYRLMGQKFLIDSYVFSQVVYDHLYYQGNEVLRMLPDPLDIMFVLGNQDALPLLKDEINQYHYAYKLEALRYLTESFDPGFWKQSLYNSWLNAIRALNPPEDNSSFPYFMQTSAWQTQKLNTQLASWTELRHDNVLYAKQSYTGGTSCSFPHVYVEPYPEFYELLYDFSVSASEFINSLPEINYPQWEESLNEYFEKFGSHMLKLKILAEKELNRESFTQEEISYLKCFINNAMGSGPYITGWYNDLFFDKEKALAWDFLVVDVHTQPTDEAGNVINKIMHTGTGYINLGIFCTGSPFGNYVPTAFIGPVMSFYEHYELNSKRLNDGEWSNFFADNKPPDRPEWSYHYLLDRNGWKNTPAVPEIPGVIYAGTGMEEFNPQSSLDYFIAFPNPASGRVGLRYFLNSPDRVSLKIYDVTGRVVFEKHIPSENAGEKSLYMDTSGFGPGLYSLHLVSSTNRKQLKLIVVE